jgi:hypothetical protein
VKSSAKTMIAAMAGLLAAIGFLSYYSNVSDQKRRADCQAAFNSTFAKALLVRADTTAERQDALDLAIGAMVRYLDKGEPTAADRRDLAAAVKLYQDAAVEANKTRDATPYPELPTCVL